MAWKITKKVPIDPKLRSPVKIFQALDTQFIGIKPDPSPLKMLGKFGKIVHRDKKGNYKRGWRVYYNHWRALLIENVKPGDYLEYIPAYNQRGATILIYKDKTGEAMSKVLELEFVPDNTTQTVNPSDFTGNEFGLPL